MLMTVALPVVVHVYGSHTDNRIKEHWYKCTKCSRWARESCGNIDNKRFYCL